MNIIVSHRQLKSFIVTFCLQMGAKHIMNFFSTLVLYFFYIVNRFHQAKTKLADQMLINPAKYITSLCRVRSQFLNP